MSENDGPHDEEAAAVGQRHHGAVTAPRRHGVYHPHRHEGWHPHPHRHVARRLVMVGGHADAVTADGVGTGTGTAGQTPLHHHQHRVSARHGHTTRRATPLTEVGQVASYDPESGTALVRLAGAPSRTVGPIALTAGVPRDAVVVGASCLVVLLDEHNPSDGVVAAVWVSPAALATPGGATLEAKLTQAGVASVGVAGASAATLAVPFPRPYIGTPVVVATATDPEWAATVVGITASGFTLTVRTPGAVAATTTVTVQWLACGV